MGEWANGRMGEWANGRMGEWANGMRTIATKWLNKIAQGFSPISANLFVAIVV
jgi:hypothetical protein